MCEAHDIMRGRMESRLTLRCEDSLEGMFTAIYDAFVYKNKMDKPYEDSITIAAGEGCMTLFTEEIAVQTDMDKVNKTIHAIQTRLGYSVYDTVLHALCHYDEERASTVLGYLVRAFAKGSRISEHMADPYVMGVLELSRKVENERQRFYGFLRFRVIQGENALIRMDGEPQEREVLFAQIEPKCNLVPIMMEHFESRYPNENFIIYDEKRKLAAVHRAYQTCVLVASEGIVLPESGSDIFEELWKQYFRSMEIKPRHNERCQNNMMPKWYRKYMPELK